MLAHRTSFALLAVASLFACKEPPTVREKSAVQVGRLLAIGPRVISNQTDYPVTIWGNELPEGAVLVVRSEPPMELATSRIDAHHLTALIPAGARVPANVPYISVNTTLELNGDPIRGDARLVIVNDAAFPTPYALEVFGTREHALIAVASPSTDEVRVFTSERGAQPPVSFHVGDGPRALARFADTAGDAWLAVALERGGLELVRAAALTSTTGVLGERDVKRLALDFDLQDVAIDPKAQHAFATSRRTDDAVEIDLDSGRVADRRRVGVNPRAIAVGEHGSLAVVANLGSDDVSFVDWGREEARAADAGLAAPAIRALPGTPIIGGHTERFSAEIIGGKAGRAIVYSDRLHVAFMSTIGPNIGPNKERMEVSMNGGISVLRGGDAEHATARSGAAKTSPPPEPSGRWLRHVSILHGVPEGLALDDDRGLLYVADGATGRLVVLDAKKVAASDAQARTAILASIALPVPEGTPLIRPAADFGVEKRSPISLHVGAKAVRLDESKTALFVLARFSGAVIELDVTRANKGDVRIVRTYPGWVGANQEKRRKGEIVYFTDAGDTRMTCDTCHPEGDAGGVMFSKGRPIRIYRGEPLRAIRESPPYFTPTRLPSIKRTAHDVLGRNRFYNPRPTEEESDAVTEYVGAFAATPNPFRGPRGELPGSIGLPDDASGSPARGLALFESKAGCGVPSCHPPPAFTADQSKETRGVLHKLGTPKALMVRPELQDLADDFGQPPGSLTGVWDLFPLFLSGAGGNEVARDGTIVAAHPFALREVLENPAWAEHGHGPSLTPEERNDLLAYLLTL